MAVRGSSVLVVLLMLLAVGPASSATAMDVQSNGAESIAAQTDAVAAKKKPKARSLVVRVSGLKAKRAKVTVKGPGLRRSISRTKVFKGLKPGKYRITARGVSLGKTTAYPTRKRMTVRVGKTSGAVARVEYGIRVSDKTQVVSPKRIDSVRQSKNGSYTIQLKGDFSRGDVIVSGVGPETPHGLLVKVTSVKDGAVEASQARLTDAIPQGEFSVSFNAPVNETKASSLASSSGPRGATKPYSCQAAAQAGLEAGVYGELPVTFGAGWGDGDPFVRVRADMRAGAYAKAWAEGEVSCTVTEKKVWGKQLAIVTVWVGPVPIVFVPRVDTYVGAGFSATGKASAEASVSVNGYAQLTAYRNRLVPESQGPTLDKGFDYQGSVALNGNAYAKLRVTVEVYGVAGPNVNVTLQPEVTAGTNLNPWWTAGLRLKAGAGIKVDKCLKVFWKEYCARFDQSKDDILNKYFELASANGGLVGGGGGGGTQPPPVTPPPTPPPGGGVVSFAPLTFDEYYDLGQGAEVSDLYIGKGVRFANTPYPILSWDSSNPTAPVLSGQPLFQGPIEFFLEKDGKPATTDKFSLDVGYLDDIGSVRVQWFGLDGSLIGSRLTTQLGIERIYVSAPGIHRVTIGVEGLEAAGYAIDNLAAGTGASPSQSLGQASVDRRPGNEGLDTRSTATAAVR